MSDPLDRLPSLGEPRPIPAGLRARLEDALLAGDARPLTSGARGRAEEALVRRARWRPVAVAVAVAAAAAGVLVLARPQDARRPSPRALPSPSATVMVGSGTAAAGAGAGTTGGVVAPPMAPAAGPPVPASASVGGSGAGVMAPARPAPSPSVASSTTPAPRHPPTVDAIAPGSGPAGTWVTLTGHDLTPTTKVTFGGVPARELKQVSPTEVRALSPAHAPGPVDVVLVTAAGSSAPRRFLYLPA